MSRRSGPVQVEVRYLPPTAKNDEQGDPAGRWKSSATNVDQPDNRVTA
jgi:hypothetical protein